MNANTETSSTPAQEQVESSKDEVLELPRELLCQVAGARINLHHLV